MAVTRHPAFDSLSACSYGLYLVHYPVAIWLQYALLAVPVGPVVKGIIVCVGTILFSWAIVVALRRVPAIAHVV